MAKILIADSGEILRMTRIQFIIEGHDAAEVTSCSALLDLCEAWEPNVVLLDLEMPSLEGRDCLRRLLTDPTYDRFPVIVFSVDPLAIEEAKRDGAFDGRAKPLGPVTLMNLIRAALGKETG